MKKIVGVIIFSFLSLYGFSQNKKAESVKWKIGVNPLSLAESQMSLGPNVSYRVADRFQLWAEASYIFRNSYMLHDWTNMKGYRFIFQPRYIFGKYRDMFLSPEFRFKRFHVNTDARFINDRGDSIKRFPATEQQTLKGGALVLGKTFTLSEKKGIRLEVTFGIGSKSRRIEIKDSRPGYTPLKTYEGRHEGIGPDYEIENSSIPYFPIGARITWDLK